MGHLPFPTDRNPMVGIGGDFGMVGDDSLWDASLLVEWCDS